MHAGQAQKEFFLNQALCLLDALHARTVTSSVPAPPSEPAEGACFRVASPATGSWTGREESIAVLIGGDWHFVPPREGMQIFDLAAGQQLVFRSGWIHMSAPAAPVGGAVIDSEARAAIATLTQALAALGIMATGSP